MAAFHQKQQASPKGICFVNELDIDRAGPGRWFFGFTLPAPFFIISMDEMADYLCFISGDEKQIWPPHAALYAASLKWICLSHKFPVPEGLSGFRHPHLSNYLHALERSGIKPADHDIALHALPDFEFPKKHQNHFWRVKAALPPLLEDIMENEGAFVVSGFGLLHTDAAIDCAELGIGRVYCPVCAKVHTAIDCQIQSWSCHCPDVFGGRPTFRGVRRVVICPSKHILVGYEPHECKE
jgi:hypothetical protein